MYYHDTFTTSSGYRTTPSSYRTTSSPIIYITTPRNAAPPSPPAPPPPSYMTPPTTNGPPSYLPSYNHPSTRRPSYVPSSNSDTLLPNCCKSINVMLSSTCYEYQHTKMGTYNIISNRLKYRTSNVSYPVYKQENGDNYIFYFSHSTWSGWLVGPEVTNNRGGLLSESQSACPADAGKWKYYSPNQGFISGEVSVSCSDWSFEDNEKHKYNTCPYNLDL